ncbi:focal adhesion kinase 1 [Trichonephila clavipes]|nr:focal adhesion kinase 1 [Trichonephila clavipes]
MKDGSRSGRPLDVCDKMLLTTMRTNPTLTSSEVGLKLEIQQITALDYIKGEILEDERTQVEDTLRRENRRVQAMSWGSSSSDEPPPKPLRHQVDIVAPPVEPTTYIVAPNPEVLAQLIQDNANSLPPAWAYVAPASPANTFTVQKYSESEDEAMVAEWYRYRIVACLVMSSSPIPLKTRCVGQRCTLNLSRAETSSRWCGVVARRGSCQLRCRPHHLTMVHRQKPSCS